MQKDLKQIWEILDSKADNKSVNEIENTFSEKFLAVFSSIDQKADKIDNIHVSEKLKTMHIEMDTVKDHQKLLNIIKGNVTINIAKNYIKK